jgi:hypothetical protein
MDFTAFLDQIHPAFYGVIFGSFLTIIGVVLTNRSNTKRLRLQHEHERDLRNKERDLNMRRQVYMDAMEAISAGITAISRFSDLHESPDSLMQSYSSLSSKESRVMIVGTNETIQALASFNVELNGAFLRLSSEREKFDAIRKRNQQLEDELDHIDQRMDEVYSLRSENSEIVESVIDGKSIPADYHILKEKQTRLQEEYEVLSDQLVPLIQNLVSNSIAEVGRLNQLLVPIVACMRAELELPFDEAFYTSVLSKGHEKLNNHLASFFENFDSGQPDNS